MSESDEEGIAALARDLEGVGWDREARLREVLDGRGLGDQLSEDDEENGLLAEQYIELADDDDDPGIDGEFEYDHRAEVTDQIPITIFDPVAMGLKEINNLAHFSVSSHKPGNSVKELLSDDLDKYWQSDGQQPHLLTIHFLRRVEIRAIRFYVDYNQDESYTPIFVVLLAGTGHHDLIEFASMPLTNPVGWQEVDLSNVGGGDDGRSLCCWIVQVQIRENHQNGKDTHIRGIKLYALDENSSANEDATLGEFTDLIEDAADRAREAEMDEDELELHRLLRTPREKSSARGFGGGSIPDFMRDPEIR